MKLDITDIETSAYQNFLDYIRNDKTKIKYSNDLKKFLDLIPNKIYKDNDITSTDKTEAFVTLVRADVKVGAVLVSKLAGYWLVTLEDWETVVLLHKQIVIQILLIKSVNPENS